MPLRLDSRSPDFESRFRHFLTTKPEAAQDVEDAVRTIIADVIARGDDALIELTRKFDRLDLSKSGLRVSPAEIDASEKACDRAALDAPAPPRHRLEAYPQNQKPTDA